MSSEPERMHDLTKPHFDPNAPTDAEMPYATTELIILRLLELRRRDALTHDNIGSYIVNTVGLENFNWFRTRYPRVFSNLVEWTVWTEKDTMLLHGLLKTLKENASDQPTARRRAADALFQKYTNMPDGLLDGS